MSDEDATAEPVVKASKRDRLKGAISRTKTKLRRRDAADGDGGYVPAHDDVEDFLAKGRNSTSTGRPSISESLASGRPSTADSRNLHPSPESILPDPYVQPQPSPRRIAVPKIDVSTSQRWPGSRPIESADNPQNELLRPHYQQRNRSASSLSKGRGRARGLSVAFTDTPPVVIGEGGDEAEVPPIEISRAKARARSASPIPTPRATGPHERPWGSRSPARRKPLPTQPSFDPRSADLPPEGLTRIQTGLSPPPRVTDSRMAWEKEFEMSLGLYSASTNSEGSRPSPAEPAQLVAPKPIHPPSPLPSIKNFPGAHELKSAHGTVNLRSKFEGHNPRRTVQELATSVPWQPTQPAQQQLPPQYDEQQPEEQPYEYPVPQLPRSGDPSLRGRQPETKQPIVSASAGSWI